MRDEFVVERIGTNLYVDFGQMNVFGFKGFSVKGLFEPLMDKCWPGWFPRFCRGHMLRQDWQRFKALV